jgi:hypothetical protein
MLNNRRSREGSVGQRVTIAILAAVLVSVIAAAQTASGQSAAPVTSRITPGATVDVSAEPRQTAAIKTPATLREATEANDFAAFDGLVRKARANGEALGAFADLHDVWSFSRANATGAYYGAEIHDRLAARYPDYAAFIEEYRITDRRGQSFFPSAETRAFLLQQAIEGNDPLAAPASSRTNSTKIAARHEITSTPVVSIKPAESLPKHALASDMSKVATQRLPQPQRKVAETEMAIDTPATTRGIFLIILGLVGIGVLTMTMQASGSDVHVSDDEPRADTPVSMAARDAHVTESHG